MKQIEINLRFYFNQLSFIIFYSEDIGGKVNISLLLFY
jgi:hypothetical protein